MFAALHGRYSGGRWLRVVHLLCDALARPRLSDGRVELHDVLGAFAQLGGVEDDVVMVIVQDEWDVELLADGEQVMDVPANVVVLEYQSVFDGWREGSVVLAEAVQCFLFVAKGAAHVENHDSVAILLGWEFEEGEQLIMVFEVSDGTFDD